MRKLIKTIKQRYALWHFMRDVKKHYTNTSTITWEDYIFPNRNYFFNRNRP